MIKIGISGLQILVLRKFYRESGMAGMATINGQDETIETIRFTVLFLAVCVIAVCAVIIILKLKG